MNSLITCWKKIGIRIKKILKRQPTDVQISEWLNCPTCKKISYLPDLVKNKYICECSYHFDLPPEERLKDLFSENYEIIDAPKTNPDPLNFEGVGQKYIDKIKKYRKTTGQQTALLIASGMINNLSAVIVCFNPKFGGGSFGPAENEHFLKATEIAMNKKVDLLLTVVQSGGISVPTNMFGLMGMPKSIIAIKEIKKKRYSHLCGCWKSRNWRSICLCIFLA